MTLRGERGLAAILAAAAAVYAVFIARTAFRVAGITYFTLVDDAMVSMRYAQHLARGLGLVWNAGQPPVEGFTNPAWMLVMSLFHLLPLPASKVSLAVMLLSALVLLANIVVVYRLCQALEPASRAAPLLAAVLVALFFPLAFWSLRGMEVGLLVLLVDAAALLALLVQRFRSAQDAWLLGALLALMVLTRLDALLQAGVLITYLAAARVDRQLVARTALPVMLAVGALLVFQRLYFGDFLPNTYYQKMAGAAAWLRVRYGSLAFYQHALWDTLLPAAVSALCLMIYRDFRRGPVFLLAALFAVQCAYSVWVGGDYAEVELDSANRFISQGMPALIVLFSLALDRLAQDPRLPLPRGRGARAALAVCALLLSLGIITGRPWLAWARHNAPLLPTDISRTRAGLLLAKYTAPAAVIAVHAAGQIPYYSGRQTIDLLGLNDPVIAHGPLTGPFYPGHDKWNYAYSILELRPDVVADNWIKLAPFMRGQSSYVRLDNGMYVRRDTTLVDVADLAKRP